MRNSLTFLFVLFGLAALATALPKDSMRTDVLDSMALEAMDERLSRLDSEHLLYVIADVPEAVDTTQILPLSDSIFAYYMADLDSRTPFEMSYNPVVKGYIERYLKNSGGRTSRMMAHGQYYFPMFEEQLAKYNMPLELKYLAVIESALNPKAKSHVGATGLWQFMYGTGKLYGLKINSYVDDRNDPLKSTEAACQYMLKLYEIFEDWNLVLAAYNSGPGNVRKAIRNSGGKTSYWEIRPFLPRETSSYVPIFIAASYAFEYGHLHGVGPAEVPAYYIETDTVRITTQLHFKQVEQELKVSAELLEFLNPQYRFKIVPVVEGQHYYLTLPAQSAMAFRNQRDSLYTLAEAYFEERASTIPEFTQESERTTHKVKSGETLGGIARNYGVGVSDIKRWNGLSSDMIRSGQRLVVYPRRL
jgi:membrane-bound lytic murein transglycosylase D